MLFVVVFFSSLRDACPEKIKNYRLKIFQLSPINSDIHSLVKMAYFISEKIIFKIQPDVLQMINHNEYPFT